MARMNEEGQWIVLMGLLVAVALFFLALIVNQSALVGQTTAEGVLEFPKNDIRDLREAVFDYVRDYEALRNNGYDDDVKNDVIAISLERKNAVVNFAVGEKRDVSGRDLRPVEIHYNNGVTEYDETVYY
jgi:predicted RecA/RadA family phage recombinase